MSEQIDWDTATWGAIGKDIVEQMKGRENDDSFLQSLASKALTTVKNREVLNDQQVAVNQINRAITKTYPRLHSEASNYWYDPKGQQNLSKWRHNIFKYMTLGRGIKPIPNQEIETPSALGQPLSQKTEQPANPPADQETSQPIPKLEDMTISALDLDDATQLLLETALSQSGLALPDFIRQAIKVYAKTITGKAKKQGEDLSAVPTDKLLSDPTYSTHSGRALELTKRTIKAIKYYNASVASEAADRWCITQSAIASLIGSRAATIGKILESFKDEIETHNQTYNLNAYTNRKRGKDITEEIKLAELVPDGVD